MKQNLLHWIMTALALCICDNVYAYSFLVDGIAYDVSSEEAATVSVTYAKYKEKGGSYAGPVEIPAAVEYDNKTYSVTEVGFSAFEGCSGLTSVTIPNSVTEIGYFAFEGCSGLTSVTIPNSVTTINPYAFRGCSGLTTLNIPNSVSSLGWDVFNGCSGLTNVTIGNSVYIIPSSAFKGCSGLTSVAFPSSVTTIGAGAFSGCTGLKNITIPSTVRDIHEGAFRDCIGLRTIRIEDSDSELNLSSSKSEPWDRDSSCSFFSCAVEELYVGRNLSSWNALCNSSALKSVTIGDSVTEIGDYAFYKCSGLTNVDIPNSVTTIGKGAFYDCSGLTDVVIPNSVTSINDHTFWDCSGLKNVTIGNSVTKIGIYAFSGCHNLTSLTIGNSVKSIADYAFESCCHSLTSLTIPRSVTSIGKRAFSGKGLKTLKIEDGDSELQLYDKSYIYSFEYCAVEELYVGRNLNSWQALSNTVSLKSLTIGPSVTKIGECAFDGCSGLTSATLSNSVTTIGVSAFSNCSSLTSMSIPNSVIGIKASAFYGCSGLKTLRIEDGDLALRLYGFLDSFTDCAVEELYVGRNIVNWGALCNTTSLRSVTISNSVTTIGSDAFKGCSGLTHLTIPNSVTTIESSAFENCSGLTSLTIPNSVTTIEYNAFRGSGLTSITIGNSVTTIGSSAFEGCSGLTSIIIPNSVTSIGSSAFKNCGALTSLTIPNSVQDIYGSAFKDCGGLKSIRIEDGDSELNLYSSEYLPDCDPFSFCVAEELYVGRNLNSWDALGNKASLKSVTIGNTVTEMPKGAFAEASSLKNVTFGSGLTKIPANAFKECSITEIAVPSNVTEIGENAFADNKLTNVIIGYGTTKIGANAFTNNNDITSINVTAVEPPQAGTDVFTTQNAQLNVLPESREAYENVQCWNRFEGTDLVPVTVCNMQNEAVQANVPSSSAANAPKQLQLIVSVEPTNASLRDFIFWSSSNPKVATVDNNGLVTFPGTSEGSADITAHTLYADVVASITVTADGNIESGIDDIFNDSISVNTSRPNDVYNLQGICLKRNVTEDDIDALPAGLYIIAGKKVLVK